MRLLLHDPKIHNAIWRSRRVPKTCKYRGADDLNLSHNIVGIGDLKPSLNIQLAMPGSTYR